jgi:hypothetical protein
VQALLASPLRFLQEWCECGDALRGYEEVIFKGVDWHMGSICCMSREDNDSFFLKKKREDKNC